MNAAHLLRYVIRPTLDLLDAAQLKLVSRPDSQRLVAEALVLGTAITESRLEYLHQIGGPAIGLWQMEPATFEDIVNNWLAYNLDVRNAVYTLAPAPLVDTDMHGNLFLGAAMCRIHYRRVKAPLPALEADDLAAYWKEYYNTPLGKGKAEDAAPHFLRAIEVVERC